MISNLSKPIIKFLYKHKIFILVNTFILTVYLLSIWFSYSVIVINISNNHYSVYLNGKLIDQITDNSFSSGGISVYPNYTYMLFDTPISPKVLSIKVEDSSGSIILNKKNIHTTGYQSWINYKTTILIHGLPNLTLTFHEQQNKDGIILVLRSFFDIDYGLKKSVSNQETLLTGHKLDIEIIPAVILLIRQFLQSYPYALLFLILIYLIQKALFFYKPKIQHFSEKQKVIIYSILLFLIFISAFILLIFINVYLLEGIPHVPDSAIYLMQSKIFATGKLFATPAIFEKYYKFFDSLAGGMVYRNGKWFSEYPFGHPIALSVGTLFNVPWLIPPLIGTLFLILLSLVSHKLFGKKITILLLIITIMSPFYQSNASNFMSHNTASFYLIGFLFFFLRTFNNSSPLNPILSSIFFGLLFNTRILTAIAIFVPFALFTLYQSKYSKRLLYFIPGGLFFLLLYFGYNKALTGNPFLNPYQLTSTPSLGFFPSHTIASALLDTLTNVSILFTFAFGWPQNITFLLVTIAFILPPVKKLDLLFLISIFSIMLSWLLFKGSYVMYGPRYYYETLPFFILLSGSGICKLIRISRHKNITFFLIAILIAFLSIHLFNGWVLNKTKLWNIINTPGSIWQLKGFNYTNANLINKVKEQKIYNALIFVKPCSYSWQCDALPLSLNNPNFDGDIVWAKDRGEENVDLIKAYPGRNYYKADYESVLLEKLTH